MRISKLFKLFIVANIFLLFITFAYCNTEAETQTETPVQEQVVTETTEQKQEQVVVEEPVTVQQTEEVEEVDEADEIEKEESMDEEDMKKQDDEEFERDFKQYDQNGDGELDINEIKLLIPESDEAEIKDLMELADRDKSGTLSYQEYKKASQMFFGENLDDDQEFEFDVEEDGDQDDDEGWEEDDGSEDEEAAAAEKSKQDL